MFFCTLTCIDCIYKTLNLIYDSTKKYWTCSSAKTRNCPPSPLQWHVENSHPFLSTSVVPGKKVLSTRWFTVDSDSGSMGWQHHLHHFWESRSENKIHQNPYTAGWLEHHNIWFFPAPCLKNCILTPVKMRSTKAWKKNPWWLMTHHHFSRIIPYPPWGIVRSIPTSVYEAPWNQLKSANFFLERNLLSFPRRSKQAMLGLACTGWSFQCHFIFEKNSQLPFLQQARAAETFSWGLRGLIRAESGSFMLK